MKRTFFLFIFQLLLSGLLSAQQLPQGVLIYQLDNGLEILLIKNPLLPMTGVNVVVKTGSAHENFATSGMSHMLEHLLFNGTTSRSQKELYDAVDFIGGYNNANTSTFYTNFMMVTPAEHIKKGIEIQADMLFYSILPVEKFAKEKGIVLEEIARSINSGDNQIERNTKSVLYKGHAASLPTLGTYATIEAMQRDDVYNFYKNAYVPNNMVMSVIGDFQIDSMMTWIEKYYGSIAPKQVMRPAESNWLTGLAKTDPVSDAMIHRNYNGETVVVDMFYYLPLKLSYPQIDLLQAYFEQVTPDIESSLKKAQPELIQSSTLELIPSPIIDYLKISLRLNQDRISQDLINIVSRQVQTISFGISDETVKSQAIKTKTAFFKNIEKPHMFGIYNAELFAVHGIEAVLMSYEGTQYSNAAKGLSTLKLNEKPVTIIHYPFRQKSAQTEKDITQTKYVKDTENGLTVIARENPANQLLAIHYFIKHKAPLEAQFGKNAAWLLHDCVGQRLKSPEIRKRSADFGFTYTVNDNPFIPMDNIYLHPDFSYIRAEGLADNSAAAIDFLNKLLVNFKPTTDEFSTAITNRMRIDKGGMPGDRARDVFEKTYSRYIYTENPYEEKPVDISHEKLTEFALDFFSPANVIISVVSPVKADSALDLFQNSYVRDDNIKLSNFEVYSQKLITRTEPVSEIIDGGGEQSFIFWGFTVPADLKDYAALKALSLVLSDRITFDIREKQGRAYRMNSGIDIIDSAALFYVKLGTRPENIDPIKAQMPSFFTLDYLSDLTQDEITKAINMYLGRMMFRRLSSINQAYCLANSEYFYRDMYHDQQQLAALNQVSLENVLDAAKRYMVIQNPVSVIVR